MPGTDEYTFAWLAKLTFLLGRTKREIREIFARFFTVIALIWATE
jgi:hypothetical protein